MKPRLHIQTVPNPADEFDEAAVVTPLAKQSDSIVKLAERLETLQDEVRHLCEQQARMAVHLDHALHLLNDRKWYNPFQIRQRLSPRLFVLQQHLPRRMTIPGHYAIQAPLAEPPLISIVTPSFNQGKFLPRTLDSVLDQNYPRLEFIVQDGGSTDNSPEVLERYDDRLTHWVSARDDGQASAINRGFARTSGQIMAWLNSDDMLLPGSLAYVANYFAKHPAVDVVYGHRNIVNEDDHLIGSWLLPPHDDGLLPWLDFVPQETLFWRRRIWDRVGGRVDESFDFALDWDLLLRFQAAGAKMVRLPRFLGAFRVMAGTKTSAKSHTVGKEEIHRLHRRTLGFIPSPDEVRHRAKPYLRRHMWRRILHKLGLIRY